MLKILVLIAINVVFLFSKEIPMMQKIDLYMTVKGFSNQEAFLQEMFKGLEQPEEEEDSTAPVFDELFNFGSFDDASMDDMDDFHQSILANKNNRNTEESGEYDGSLSDPTWGM